VADSSEVDSALIAILSSDATLMALMPGGVAWEVATAGTTKFVLVSQIEHGDTYELPGPIAWERFLYLVKAVAQGSSGTDVRPAAARIHELLQDAPLVPTGYHPRMVLQRTDRIRYTEVDEVTDERWQHRGGHYEVLVCPQ
jgi:hypothetical protein